VSKAAEQRARERTKENAKNYKTPVALRFQKRFAATRKKPKFGRWAFAPSHGTKNGKPI